MVKATKKKIAIPEVLPVLPLRNIVIFPNMIVPLFVGRDQSIRALDDAMDNDKEMLLLPQKDGDLEEALPQDMREIGVIGTVLQMLRLPDGTVKVMVEGNRRAKVINYLDNPSFLEAAAEVLREEVGDVKEIKMLAGMAVRQFKNYAKANRKIPNEIHSTIAKMIDPIKVVDTIAGHLKIPVEERQQLLEVLSIIERLERVLGYMEGEVGALQVEKKIRGRVQRQMEKTQRNYYLNEQLKAIQQELTSDGEEGEGGEATTELQRLAEAIKKTKFSKEAREKAQAELKKLRSMHPMSPESTGVRNYIDWLLSVPWGKKSRIKKNIATAEKMLNADHYGLDKVKERILEYLAVQQRSQKLRGPILCLVGPPGVGKTSLGKSIAAATGREFVRMSLGGVRDEADIRGHRRTYLGSLPGRMIQSMKKVKTTNPLMLLDEIDKLGADFRGNPAAALLEVLDPEQNDGFVDHYMEIGYDLSNVMFVTTANSLNIPSPLLDRLEVIRIAGYTEDEKVGIAKQHLLPNIVEEHGLRKGEFKLGDTGLRKLIQTYTREAGVRGLKRELASLARKATTEIVKGKAKKVAITPNNLKDFAGVERYRFGLAEKSDQIGVVTGLAWTEVGGELLTIEGVMLTGKGRMTTTGKLGDVMKESINAASSYVRSRSTIFGIEPPLFERKDIHVHVPEGATPKDGPSAGTAMATAIVSIMTDIPVHKEIAMTGEVTLRGRILPIGGLKEKLLAALRGGITKVLIPIDNKKDLAEVPDNIKENLEIIAVENMDEVLSHALVRVPSAIEWDEEDYYANREAMRLATPDGTHPN